MRHGLDTTDRMTIAGQIHIRTLCGEIVSDYEARCQGMMVAPRLSTIIKKSDCAACVAAASGRIAA